MSDDDGHVEKALLSIETATLYLGGISKVHLHRLMKTGQVRYLKIGRRTFFERSELDRFINRQATATAERLSSRGTR